MSKPLKISPNLIGTKAGKLGGYLGATLLNAYRYQ